MITTLPKGYDFENYLRRKSRDNFKSLKNPSVTKRRLSRFAYSNEVCSLRQRYMANAPRAILTKYNNAMEINTRSLQSFARAYFDPLCKELVVERGNQEPIRVYDALELRWLTYEDIYMIESMKIEHNQSDEVDVQECYTIIKKLANMRRG
ncbi:hypothetical protein L1987_12104 [Smallanthus sonchifolius]|uniref:Uncharacterized protein n=1 Tax=Smallanthus sonchifolius TaxID=185202 RepID=A0ACB9JFG5_9ASTR|nr:hypothetical protein L1987_12104 [Smallanthus sonchifolius]